MDGVHTPSGNAGSAASDLVTTLENSLDREVDRLYVAPSAWVPKGWMRIQLLENMLKAAELTEDYALCGRIQNVLTTLKDRYGLEGQRAGISH
jgi:hypothetical protein